MKEKCFIFFTLFFNFQWWRHPESTSGIERNWHFQKLILQPHGLYSPWNSPGQNTGVGGLSFLQGIFPIQGSNPSLPHCRRILYQLSHQGSPRIVKWVAYLFSSGSSSPRNWTGVPGTAGRFFTNWAIKEALDIEGKRRRDDRGWDGWTASLIQWTRI